MCIVFSIIRGVYWCLWVTSLSMFIDGSSHVSFPRPFIICIHVSYILRVRWVTSLLGALCRCPFHHYIHWLCDFTSCWIRADHHLSSCSLLHYICSWFIHCVSPLDIFLQWPIFRFVTLFASSLHISLSVWFFLFCLVIVIIFTLGTLGSMTHGIFCTCCISYMRAWVFYHWVFGPSFPSFLLPYHPNLCYIPCFKTTLRPWDQMSSSTPLLGRVFEIWLIFGWHHASSSGGRCIDVWVHFSSGFGWLGLHIWWLMI